MYSPQERIWLMIHDMHVERVDAQEGVAAQP